MTKRAPIIIALLAMAFAVGGQALPGATAQAAPPAQPDRVKWRIRVSLDYFMHTPGVGPDGTIYIPNLFGKTQAVAPDGTTRWTFPAGGTGAPISVAGDGTVIVAGGGPGAVGGTDGIFAINPNGTLRWGFTGAGDYLIAGPSIGPDGNIYAVTDYVGIGFFSLTPTGQLRFATGRFTEHGSLGQRIAFGPDRAYFGFDMQGVTLDAFFAYDLNGNLKWTVGQPDDPPAPVAGPNGNVVFLAFPTNIGKSLWWYSPSGQRVASFYEFPGNTHDAPDVGPDNIVYSVRNLSTLLAHDPDGSVRWRYTDTGIMFQPVLDPTNRILFTGGRITYGEPGFFRGVSTAGQPLWEVPLPTEPGFAEYGQLVPVSRPVFSPDGSTAYAIADVAGDGNVPYAEVYSYVYAIDTTGEGSPAPTVPAAPSGLAATAGTSSVGLRWADNASNETGYRVERCTGSSCTSFAQVAALAAGATAYTDPGLAAGTTYRYRVAATNAAGSSGYSNVAGATTPSSDTVPAAPTNLSGQVSGTRADLTWVDRSTNETGFTIERCAGRKCSNFAAIGSVGPNVTAYANTGLAPNTRYSYRVRATGAAGSSVYSNRVNLRTP